MAAGYIFLPMVPEMRYSSDVTRQIEMARASGFVVFDLSDVYDGQRSDTRCGWRNGTRIPTPPDIASSPTASTRLFQQNRDRLLGSRRDPRLRATR